MKDFIVSRECYARAQTRSAGRASMSTSRDGLFAATRGGERGGAQLQKKVRRYAPHCSEEKGEMSLVVESAALARAPPRRLSRLSLRGIPTRDVYRPYNLPFRLISPTRNRFFDSTIHCLYLNR